VIITEIREEEDPKLQLKKSFLCQKLTICFDLATIIMYPFRESLLINSVCTNRN
jgi:hypothetical protein